MIGKQSVKTIRSRFISFMRLFGGSKVSEIVINPISSDVRLVTIPIRMPRDAFEACFVCARRAHVFHILGARRLAEIEKAVVAWIAIDVVNLVFGPLASHKRPRDAMASKAYAINMKNDIPSPIFRSQKLAGGNLSTAYLRSKIAADGIIADKRSKAFDWQRMHCGVMAQWSV